MYKKKYDREESEKRLKRTMVRNWIIMFGSLALIIICYYLVR